MRLTGDEEKGREEHSGRKCVRDERKKNSRGGEVEIASETGTPLIHHCKSRLSRTCRHPIYIYTHLPVSMGI